MKIDFVKIVLIGVFGIPIIIILTVGLLYINFIRLDTYVRGQNGDLVSKTGVTYQFDPELSGKYNVGELNSQGLVGRFEGVSFFKTYFGGPKIVKLKGYDGKDVFLVRGIMLQEVLKRKN